ncbi:MAG: hypothetical protein P8045_03980 [Candidatus Thiodiazotropha sp.]
MSCYGGLDIGSIPQRALHLAKGVRLEELIYVDDDPVHNQGLIIPMPVQITTAPGTAIAWDKVLAEAS